MPRKDLGTYRYRQLRAAFLADKAACHWCGIRTHKLTVDHLYPVALMGESHSYGPLDVENWVAACLPCNSRRGAQLRNALRPTSRRRRRPAIGFPPREQW